MQSYNTGFRREERGKQLVLLVREALLETVMVSGLAFVEEALEAEREAICRPRYRHQGGRSAAANSRELSLPSWLAWSSADPLEACSASSAARPF